MVSQENKEAGVVKIIKITKCGDCPFHGDCKAWKRLTSAQRVRLTLGVGVTDNFILKGCHLDDDPDYVPEPCQG